MGILLELQIAKSMEEAEKMVKEVRPEITIHPEFLKDLQTLYSNKSIE